MTVIDAPLRNGGQVKEFSWRAKKSPVTSVKMHRSDYNICKWEFFTKKEESGPVCEGQQYFLKELKIPAKLRSIRCRVYKESEQVQYLSEIEFVGVTTETAGGFFQNGEWKDFTIGRNETFIGIEGIQYD